MSDYAVETNMSKGSFGEEYLSLGRNKLVEMFRTMVLIRRFEEMAAKMYSMQKIGGFLHLYIGQEAVAVGSVAAIRDDDYMITAYRDHGHAIARGTDPKLLMAELFGKYTGTSKGKGGSMHFFDASRNMLGGHAIVGGQIPLGTGIAFKIKYRREDKVCLTYMGDAAVNQGTFHESLNLAALWKLPVVYIVENNLYGMGTAVDRASAVTELYKRGCSYGIEGMVADGMNVFSVYDAIKEAAKKARELSLPTLLEIRTYRFRGHSMSDPDSIYRTKQEVEEEKQRDPIEQMKKFLLEEKIATQKEIDDIDAEVKKVVAEAVEFAENSSEPPLESMYDDIYVS
ncbi:MAG: pyruvate dehydrogenase (acetyl-transferring) E1 component subunit alpha [Bacteroidetes bacterium]|nr:pyruvate dehydrogenase (acetyl-transferring) E1 component subunit alpha [Bacteroidota bacterium]MCL5737643.1 pyruvate dehydrogenase (acetyl-transferring) E1 component subunit alpha [Bacteroidota bacterium]